MWRKLMVLACVVAVCAIGLAQEVASGGAGAATTPTTGWGTNFLIESQIDNHYCIESQGATNAGRPVTLQQCSTTSFQRWALPHLSDETNLLVEDQGMCIDGHFKKANVGLAVLVQPCGTGRVWRFTFTAAGQVMDVADKTCLSIPGASANAAVSLAPCDETVKGQLWKLAH